MGAFVAAQPPLFRFIPANERSAESKYGRRAHVPGVTILAFWCADGRADHRVGKEVMWDAVTYPVNPGQNGMGKILKTRGSLSVGSILK